MGAIVVFFHIFFPIFAVIQFSSPFSGKFIHNGKVLLVELELLTKYDQ